MPLYKNNATDLVLSWEEWLQWLPLELLLPGETWGELLEELLALGLFTTVTPEEPLRYWDEFSERIPVQRSHDAAISW